MVIISRAWDVLSPPMDMICITHGRVHGVDNDNPAVLSGITVCKELAGSLTVKHRNVHPVGKQTRDINRFIEF